MKKRYEAKQTYLEQKDKLLFPQTIGKKIPIGQFQQPRQDAFLQSRQVPMKINPLDPGTLKVRYQRLPPVPIKNTLSFDAVSIREMRDIVNTDGYPRHPLASDAEISRKAKIKAVQDDYQRLKRDLDEIAQIEAKYPETLRDYEDLLKRDYLSLLSSQGASNDDLREIAGVLTDMDAQSFDGFIQREFGVSPLADFQNIKQRKADLMLELNEAEQVLDPNAGQRRLMQEMVQQLAKLNGSLSRSAPAEIKVPETDFEPTPKDPQTPSEILSPKQLFAEPGTEVKAEPSPSLSRKSSAASAPASAPVTPPRKSSTASATETKEIELEDPGEVDEFNTKTGVMKGTVTMTPKRWQESGNSETLRSIYQVYSIFVTPTIARTFKDKDEKEVVAEVSKILSQKGYKIDTNVEKAISAFSEGFGQGLEFISKTDMLGKFKDVGDGIIQIKELPIFDKTDSIGVRFLRTFLEKLIINDIELQWNTVDDEKVKEMIDSVSAISVARSKAATDTQRTIKPDKWILYGLLVYYYAYGKFPMAVELPRFKKKIEELDSNLNAQGVKGLVHKWSTTTRKRMYTGLPKGTKKPSKEFTTPIRPKK